MTLKLANALIEKVKAEAARVGVNAVVAVSDKAGRPVAVQCMDDAYIASFDIALNKTYTSASLKMSTAELSQLSQPGQPLYGIQFTNDGKIVIFGVERYSKLMARSSVHSESAVELLSRTQQSQLTENKSSRRY